ncbi:MAG: hypothetical protein ACSLFN_11420 [Candidatus Limnocylindrales bacterium]
MPRAGLPIVEQAPAETGACCAACAATPAPAATARVSRPTIERDRDRQVTMAGLLVTLGFFVAALATWAIGSGEGRPVWLPLHLALAGGAATAVASVLPFFTAALAVARPAATWIRVLSIALVAGGAVAVSVSVAGGQPGLGAVGGSAYIAGVLGVGVAAFRPLHGSLGTRRRLVERAYAIALVHVAVSAAAATALLAGWLPIAARWVAWKPAHAWLNLVGFVSLIIVATLVHLAPTVEGGRIQPRRSATMAIAGLALGVPTIAIGYVLSADLLTRLGGVLVAVGAMAVPVHALVIWRSRGRWTTDPGWHRLTAWSLRAAGGWFAAAVLVGVGRLLWFGADPSGWSLATVVAPLAVGWIIQVVLGSMTHLLPAIGPGDQAVHRVQRHRLGSLATARLLALNLGVAGLWAGHLAGSSGLVLAGALAVAAALLGAVALAVLALAAGGPWQAFRLASSQPSRY